MSTDIKSRLMEKALNAVTAMLEAEIATNTQMPAAGRPADQHHRHIGKMGIVDRVRGGKLQYRKKKSDVKGFKLVNGSIVKMTPQEIRKRKISGKISARKRRAQMASIIRKRALSLRIRSSRLNENYNETDKVFLDKSHPTIGSGKRTHQPFDSGSVEDHKKAIEYHSRELANTNTIKKPGIKQAQSEYHTMRIKMHKDHIGV